MTVLLLLWRVEIRSKGMGILLSSKFCLSLMSTSKLGLVLLHLLCIILFVVESGGGVLVCLGLWNAFFNRIFLAYCFS